MRLQEKHAVALTCAVGLFMAVLDTTVVNVALAPMASHFHIALADVQWVVTGYTLTQAAVIPVAGYLGTRFGLKRVFLGALLAFTAGSLLCALAPPRAGAAGGLPLLVACRV